MVHIWNCNIALKLAYIVFVLSWVQKSYNKAIEMKM